MVRRRPANRPLVSLPSSFVACPPRSPLASPPQFPPISPQILLIFACFLIRLTLSRRRAPRPPPAPAVGFTPAILRR
ncbi:hypothetical protein DAI22_06g123201 [Oryza sativa Japonica Group]|nr:hypothetical protein DAI22_06g123201 [Oryza sativa Japonica Group]